RGSGAALPTGTGATPIGRAAGAAAVGSEETSISEGSVGAGAVTASEGRDGSVVALSTVTPDGGGVVSTTTVLAPFTTAPRGSGVLAGDVLACAVSLEDEPPVTATPAMTPATARTTATPT